MVYKITNENPLKAKLDSFIEEQGATRVESLWKGATDHKSLRSTGLDKGFFKRSLINSNYAIYC